MLFYWVMIRALSNSSRSQNLTPALAELTSAFGAAISLYYVTTLFPAFTRETREWIFGGSLLLVFPVLLYISHFHAPTRGAFLTAHFVHLVIVLVKSTLGFVPKLSGPGPQWWIYAIASVLIAVKALAGFLTARLLLGKVSSRNTQAFLLGSLLLYLTHFSQYAVGFPLFYFRYAIDIPVFAATAVFLWFAFFGSPARASGKAAPTLKHGLWLILFAAWGLQRIHSWDHSSFHHWAFYVGPIEMVKQGAKLLHQIPSQYGFLSILFPAALPLPAFEAFHGVFFLSLFAQALIVYSIALQFPLPRFQSTFAGIFTLSMVFWLPGNRDDLGALSYPNNSAYRFFWLVLLGLLLTPRKPSAYHSTRRLFALATVFAVSVFWSFENAIFCSGVLFCSLLPRAWALFKEGGNAPAYRPLVRELLSCVAGAFFLWLSIELIYRVGLKVKPDWTSYFEFSKAYAERFALVPISLEEALNPSLLLIVLVACFLKHLSLVRLKTRVAPYYAVWGLMLCSFPYFLSQSTYSNVYNLTAVWMPLILWLGSVGLQEAETAWAVSFKIVLFAFCAILIPFSTPNFPKKTVGNTVRSFAVTLGMASPREERPYPDFVKVKETLGPQAGLPLVNITLRESIPSVSSHRLMFKPWLPIYPADLFFILEKHRRVQYLQRYLEEFSVEKGQILRASEDPQGYASEITAAIDPYYELESVSQLSHGLVLETYRRKNTEADSASR